MSANQRDSSRFYFSEHSMERFLQKGIGPHSRISRQEGARMKRHKQKIESDGRCFAVLTFLPENEDEELDDGIVGKAMLEEKLRPVAREEFYIFLEAVERYPGKPIVAFGNTVRGGPDSGGYRGVPFCDSDGDIKIIENWTRGTKGDLWSSDWRFVFLPQDE